MTTAVRAQKRIEVDNDNDTKGSPSNMKHHPSTPPIGSSALLLAIGRGSRRRRKEREGAEVLLRVSPLYSQSGSEL